MLAYASPSYKIPIMITGLVIDCLGTNNFLMTKSSLLKLTQLCLHLNNPYFLFTHSLLSCKPIQQHLQSPSSFILVLGKANIKRAQSCIGGRQNLREYLFYLQLLVGFDTLTYRKRLQLIPYTCGLSRPFFGVVAGEQQHGVNILVCACLLYHLVVFISSSKLFSIFSYGYGTRNTKKLGVLATHGDGESPKTLDARYVESIKH